MNVVLSPSGLRSTDWLTQAFDDALTFPVPVTPHVFRHSFAMHHSYQYTSLKVLQAFLGWKVRKCVRGFFTLHIAASQQITFSMPESQAVTLLK